MTDQEECALPAERSLPLLTRRLRLVLELDPAVTALAFEESNYPWSFFADAVQDVNALLDAYPEARRIGIVLRNKPGPLAALLATIATGRQVITLSPHGGDAALADDIASLRPDVIVAEDEDWARESLASSAASAQAVALVTSNERAVGAHSAHWDPAPCALPTDGVAVLMMTSGTTGKPKRVALTYAQLTAALNAAGTTIDDAHEPRLRNGTAILWYPLTHISGLYFAIAHALEGRTIALMERFEVTAWAELVRYHRPKILRMPPAALRMVLKADVPRDTFSSVRAIGSGTAPVPPELRDEFESRYGVPVLVTYGATEFAGAIAGWSLKDHQRWAKNKRGSVGRAHRGIQLRIVDPDTQDVLSSRSVGLLEARGGQLPTQNGEWLRTNDLASLDEDGFLFIHGRADDAINRGGFKIPPSVIEDALREHPAVIDSAAIGLPDERLGEVPAVAVTLRDRATERELLEHLSTRLTRYQMPVALQILDQLPQTPSMKVSRALVRDIFIANEAARDNGSRR